jgi:hypothetical protein
MKDILYKGETSKASEVARVVNRMLEDIVLTCVKGDETRDYFEIGVIGYGDDKVLPVLGKEFALLPVSEIRRSFLRKEKIGDETIHIRVEPLAEGSTPMRAAFEKVYELLTKWLPERKESAPPIVINITDGEATDGDPADFATKVMALANKAGNVCLLNAHITDKNFKPTLFPKDDKFLEDEYAKQLFAISSQLTEDMIKFGAAKYPFLESGARGFVYNADAVVITDFLDIGTKPAALKKVAAKR